MPHTREALMRENFKNACDEVADNLFERNHVTQVIDERVALAMYKLDEALVLVDSHAELDEEDETEQNLQLLLQRCTLLRQHFAALEHMEVIVDQMMQASRKLQDRMDAVKKHAEPLNQTQISTMMKRALTLGRKVNLDSSISLCSSA